MYDTHHEQQTIDQGNAESWIEGNPSTWQLSPVLPP